MPGSRWIGAALLGAAAMYVLDPDRGRRRRALARDRVASLLHHAREVSAAAVRDAQHRAQGLIARARRAAADPGIPDDLVLIERVRARMGRVVAHPHALHVGALAGRVTLSGPILAHEVAPLLTAVRAVPGVREIEDHLVVHERPGSVPALQGGRPLREGVRWTPALRVAAVAGGVAAALSGLRRRDALGIALAATGLLVAARGARDRPLASRALRREAGRAPAPLALPERDAIDAP